MFRARNCLTESQNTFCFSSCSCWEEHTCHDLQWPRPSLQTVVGRRRRPCPDQLTLWLAAKPDLLWRAFKKPVHCLGPQMLLLKNIHPSVVASTASQTNSHTVTGSKNQKFIINHLKLLPTFKTCFKNKLLPCSWISHCVYSCIMQVLK